MGAIQYVKNSALVSTLTPRLCMMYMFLSIGAVNFGIDNGYWSALTGVTQFIKDRGVCDEEGKCSFPPTWLSVGSGTPLAGLIIGCVIAGPIIKSLGRKRTILVIVCIALVGIIIQNAAPNYWVIMAGRLINSISMGIEANNIPLYMAELAPPQVRGSMINMYQWWLFIGSLVAKIVVYKCTDNYPNSSWSWRSVLLLQVFVPLILLGVFWVLPESPTWLLSRDREDEARTSLRYIRKGAATNEEVEQELQLTKEAAQEQIELHKASTYMDCFRGTNRRRTIIAIAVQVFEQLSGVSFLGSYRVIFLKQLGITDPLLASVSSVCMGIAGSSLAFVFSDLFGRRPLMIWTALVMWACLWASCGVSAWLPGGVHGGSVAQTLLALNLIWAFCSNLGWGSCVWIVTAEVPTAQVREKTLSIATASAFISSLMITYISPYVQYAPGNIGVKIGFVWGGFSLLSAIWVYFCLPELSNRSLQELDDLFDAKVSARRFKKFVAHGIGAKITEIQDTNANKREHVLEGKYPEVAEETVETVGIDEMKSMAKTSAITNIQD